MDKAKLLGQRALLVPMDVSYGGNHYHVLLDLKDRWIVLQASRSEIAAFLFSPDEEAKR